MANRILPRLRQGQQAVEYMGDIYFLSTDWELYSEPKTDRYWYYNKMTKESQFEFPTKDSRTRKAISIHWLPTGWVAYYWYAKKGEFAWWWNKEKEKGVNKHPLFDKIETFGVWKTDPKAKAQCEWDFRRLRGLFSSEKIVQQIFEMLKHPTLEEALVYFMFGDPAQVKQFSKKLRDQLPGEEKPVDLIIWTYTVMLVVAQQVARGCTRHHRCKVMHHLFEELDAKYPSLQQKWPATSGSLVKKGDVVEVALAYARMQGPAIPPSVADDRREFQAMVQQFSEGLQDTVSQISSFDLGNPTSKYLPNPNNFGRLVAFNWSGMHNHTMIAREDYFGKADDEIAKLHLRMGANNWNNCTILRNCIFA